MKAVLIKLHRLVICIHALWMSIVHCVWGVWVIQVLEAKNIRSVFWSGTNAKLWCCNVAFIPLFAFVPATTCFRGCWFHNLINIWIFTVDFIYDGYLFTPLTMDRHYYTDINLSWTTQNDIIFWMLSIYRRINVYV